MNDEGLIFFFASSSILKKISRSYKHKLPLVYFSKSRKQMQKGKLLNAPFLFKPPHAPSSTEASIKLLKRAADTKNPRIGKTIHAQLILSAQIPTNDVAFSTSLINFYGKCNNISTARKLFDEMRERNVVSYGALMNGYLQNGFSLVVMKLLKYMVSSDSVKPNEYIFATVISSCTDSRNVVEGLQCHGFVIKMGLLCHQFVRNTLVHFYSKCLSVKEALRVLDSMPMQDVFICNSVLNGLVENGYLEEGLEVLRRMLEENVLWDGFTYVGVFGFCGCLKDLKLGLQVHGKMVLNGVECDLYVGSAIVNMYGNCGDWLNAKRVFNRFCNRNVVLWTAIMAAYLQNGRFEETLNLFPKMVFDDVKPNELTFAVVLNACAGLSTLRHGYLFHALVEKSGFKDHLSVGNALIKMYCKGGNIEGAKKVFLGMKYKDTITWNAMICGYSHHGLGKEAFLMFQDMLANEEHPNYVTFVGVLSACSHEGWVDKGFYYLNHLMKDFGIEPGLEHYTCIVNLLSKAGRVDEALNFMKCSPLIWDVVAWRTLLNACLLHRNYDLGLQVAELVLQTDPADVGTYTLLSNMYAKAKRWDGVVKMRKLMRDKNIKKEPGVSWIEIRNVTHIFLSDDSNHPERSQIYRKAKELLEMIKPLGYTPNIDSVLHDVEDEQKEDYLSYHSEKLAIAYGLLRTPSEASIFVIKNLRMCDDCHLAVKLISKVTNRIIVVRDAKRFHHFQDGCCSCTDYW